MRSRTSRKGQAVSAAWPFAFARPAAYPRGSEVEHGSEQDEAAVKRARSLAEQRFLPFGECLLCGHPAIVEYPGPYVPEEYPAREWYPSCAWHRRNVARMASWRRQKADQEPKLRLCGSSPRKVIA